MNKGGAGRRPFTVSPGSRHPDFPTLAEATAKVKRGRAIIFYERGFFGVVWRQGKVRMTRTLTGWENKHPINEAHLTSHPFGLES